LLKNFDFFNTFLDRHTGISGRSLTILAVLSLDLLELDNVLLFGTLKVGRKKTPSSFVKNFKLRYIIYFIFLEIDLKNMFISLLYMADFMRSKKTLKLYSSENK